MGFHDRETGPGYTEKQTFEGTSKAHLHGQSNRSKANINPNQRRTTHPNRHHRLPWYWIAHVHFFSRILVNTSAVITLHYCAVITLHYLLRKPNSELFNIEKPCPPTYHSNNKSRVWSIIDDCTCNFDFIASPMNRTFSLHGTKNT